MSQKAISAFPGDVLPNTPGFVHNNRTGATTVKGGVGFVDDAASDAATTTTYGQDNVVAVTLARIVAGTHRLAVWAVGSTADDGAERAVVGDDLIVDLLVNSTTDIAKGDPLIPVASGDHMVKGSIGNKFYAVALEARTANDEGTIKARLFSSGRSTGNFGEQHDFTATSATDLYGIGRVAWSADHSKAYRWVKYNNGQAVAAVAGNFCYVHAASGTSAGEINEVTMDLSDSAEVGAGILQAIIADGEYGWIQVSGSATLTTALTAGADGDPLTPTGSTDGTLDVTTASTDHICAVALDASAKIVRLLGLL